MMTCEITFNLYLRDAIGESGVFSTIRITDDSWWQITNAELVVITEKQVKQFFKTQTKHFVGVLVSDNLGIFIFTPFFNVPYDYYPAGLWENMNKKLEYEDLGLTFSTATYPNCPRNTYGVAHIDSSFIHTIITMTNMRDDYNYQSIDNKIVNFIQTNFHNFI